MLYATDGTNISLAFKLDYYTKKDYRTNQCLKHVNPDAPSATKFKLFIKQVNGEFTIKEISLIPYQIAIIKLVKSFENMWFEHKQQADNQHADPWLHWQHILMFGEEIQT